MNVPAKRKNELAPAEPLLPEGYETGQQDLAVSLAIAEIDQQITTAHAFPRSIDRAVKNILSLATMDEETAEECIYALPRGKKPIKGPSIRLAEIIQSQWGNCRTGTRVTHVDRIERFVEAEGVFHDLESNAATTARVRRRISDKEGRLLTDDMILVTSNAAASIAKRNAILAGVPKAIWRRAYQEVERVLVGDVRTMAVKRDEAIKAFAGFGVKPEQLFATLEIGGLDDIGPDEYTTLRGMWSALKSGEATVEEMFPAEKKAAGKGSTDLKDRLDKLADEDAGGEEIDQMIGKDLTGIVEGITELVDPETGEVTEAKAKAAPPRKAKAETKAAAEGGDGISSKTGSVAADEKSQATTVAEEVNMDTATAASPEAAATSPQDGTPPVDPDGEGGSDGPSSAAADLRTDAISRFLRIAADRTLGIRERLQEIDLLKQDFEERLPDEFLRACVKAAAAVAQNEMKPADARAALEAKP